MWVGIVECGFLKFEMWVGRVEKGIYIYIYIHLMVNFLQGPRQCHKMNSRELQPTRFVALFFFSPVLSMGPHSFFCFLISLDN